MAIITKDAAMRAIQVGLAKADELSEPSCVAVVDPGGNLMAFGRSDGAPFGLGEIAINKAFTSAALNCATAALYKDAQPGGEIYGIEVSGRGRPFVVFGGGVPIRKDGRLIGAVGVSGGPVASDLAISAAMASECEK